jgi:hypothetical protein
MKNESLNESLKDIMSLKDRQSYTFHLKLLKTHAAAVPRIRHDDIKREHHRKMAEFHLDQVNALVSKYYPG